MNRKWNYETVKIFFEDKGCILLSETYKNTDEKLNYTCVCGRPHSISFDAFKRGARCKACGILKASQNHKHKIHEVAKIFEDGGCKLISTYFQDARTPLDYMCECGNPSKITLDSFKKGTRCMACGQKKSHDAQRLSYDYVYKFFIENDCLLISSEYKSFHETLDYVCECGEPSKITLADFKAGKRCWGCRSKKIGDSHRLDYDFVKLFFENNNCTLLSLSYNTAREQLDYICQCGKHSKIVFDKFRIGQRCSECGDIKNSGENHWNYNEEITDEERQLRRNYPEYKIWTSSVLKRDNFTCQCCGQYGGKLNAHHLDGYSWCIEKRTDVENGITLCDGCHRDFHFIYGNIGVNKKHWLEYLEDFLNEAIIV